MAETHRENGPDKPAPPPVRRNWVRPVALGGAGLIVGVLILVVVLGIEPGGTSPDELPVDDDVIELISPDALQESEKQADATDPMRDVQLRLEQGGWVQVADPETGELSQQYRCSRLDPDPPDTPDGYMQMNRPRAEIFLDDGRVLTLAGDAALTYAPNRALESGTLTGNVLIRLYELGERRSPDSDVDTPALTLRTEQAVFDNYLGEVTCEQSVRIETPQAVIPGRGLTLQYNDQLERIELLRMEQVEYIRLHALAGDDSSPSGDSAPTSPQPLKDASPRDETTKADALSSKPGSKAKQKRPDNNASESIQHYRLTLTDNVVIEQRFRDRPLRTARGDELIAHFSNETRGLDRALGTVVPKTQDAQNIAMADEKCRMTPVSRTAHGNWPALIATSAVAAAPESTAQSPTESAAGDESVTTITFNGPLIMKPVPGDEIEALAVKSNEAHFELTGRPVYLQDAERSLDATGHRFTFRTGRERMDLMGTESIPVEVNSPQLKASAAQFWINQTNLRGGFVGPGRMRTPERAADAEPIEAGVSSNPELTITWKEGVDLHFAESEDDTSAVLSGATFNRDINVVATDFSLDCDSMHVAFETPDGLEPAGRDQRIRTINAHGNVRARGIDRNGSIICEELMVELDSDDAGRTIPSRMLAQREVRAEHEQQTVWSETLEVTFQAISEDNRPDENISSESSDTGRFSGNVRIDTLIANTNVQIRLKDGTRAYADRMVGNAIDETVVLTGDDVLMLAKQTIIDQGTHVEVHNASQTATWQGGGRFLSYKRPFDIVTADQISRPTINVDYVPGDAEVRATWTQSLEYNAKYNDGAGSVTLVGDVKAQSTPSLIQRDTVTADQLTLDFIRVDTTEGTNTDATRRQLERLTALGAARLESRAWRNPERTDLPRIFYIEGQDIQYNDLTMHAVVDGAGQVFIVDEHDAPATEVVNDDSSTDQPAQAESSDPFAGKGRTSFRWTRKLEMTRAAEADQFDVDMTGDVAVRHLSTDGQAGILTCDALAALIERPNLDQQSQQAAMDLGGPAELIRLSGRGNVFVDTPSREVECDVFDYDRTSGRAELSATDDRKVIVHTTGTARPLRADHVLWNMIEDTMTVEGASGRGG